MASNKKQKEETKVVETKEEITLLDEEIETMVEEPQETETKETEEETTETETETTEEEKTKEDEVKEEPQETEKVVGEIDPRVQAILNLNKKSKLPEKDKQAKIYSAMAKIQVERR